MNIKSQGKARQGGQRGAAREQPGSGTKQGAIDGARWEQGPEGG